MRSSAVSMHLGKRIDSGNASRIVGAFAVVVAEDVQSRAKAIVQHLETVALRLNESDLIAKTSQVYDLIAAVNAENR